MFTSRVASEPGGTKCATARKSWCAAPNFFHVNTPASTLPTRLNFENIPWSTQIGGCSTQIGG
eukprot:4444414-Prymnesium_polylepis.1